MSSLISAPDFLTLQAVCNYLNVEVEVGAEITFEFDESDQIRLDIPKEGIEEGDLKGWSIIPLVLPLVRMHASLQNASINTHGSCDNPTPCMLCTTVTHPKVLSK